MNKDTQKIFENLGSTLEATIPQFKMVKETTDQMINKVVTQEMESKMTPEQKELLNGARNACNLKGTNIGDKLEELTKLMKKCQFG